MGCCSAKPSVTHDGRNWDARGCGAPVKLASFDGAEVVNNFRKPGWVIKEKHERARYGLEGSQGTCPSSSGPQEEDASDRDSTTGAADKGDNAIEVVRGSF